MRRDLKLSGGQLNAHARRADLTIGKLTFGDAALVGLGGPGWAVPGQRRDAATRAGHGMSGRESLATPASLDRLALQPMPPRTTNAFDDADFVAGLKTRVVSARPTAAGAVEPERVRSYRDIGAAIREKQAVQACSPIGRLPGDRTAA